jgi:hypothetical protein
MGDAEGAVISILSSIISNVGVNLQKQVRQLLSIMLSK